MTVASAASWADTDTRHIVRSLNSTVHFLHAAHSLRVSSKNANKRST